MFLMTSWNTLLVSNQQRVHNNTLVTVKHRIQKAHNPTPAVVIIMEASCVDNSVLLNYLASEVGVEEPENTSTDRKIRIDNNYTDEKLPFAM
jgi:hypothetical protein